MNGVPLTALSLQLTAIGAEVMLLALLLRRGLGKPLLPASLRLLWGVSQFGIFLLSSYIPGQWFGIFGEFMAHYWMGAALFLPWMWWDARSMRHPLSPMVWRWLGMATGLNCILPLLHPWVPPGIQSLLTGGSMLLACTRLGVAVYRWRSLPDAQLIWLRDGRCRLEPHPYEPDYLIRTPGLLLQIVEHAATPDYRRELLRLLEARLALPAGADCTPTEEASWRRA